MRPSFRPLFLTSALLALTASAVAQPTFDAFCTADPSASFVTASLDRAQARFLYKYGESADGRVALTQLGEIEAPLNGVALYGGYLYGFHRTTSQMYKVAADGTILDVFDPLAALPDQAYIAGTVNPDNGHFYAFARNFAKMRVVDLNDPSTYSIVQFTVDGEVKQIDAADLAYWQGGIYGFDILTNKGFRADAETGVTQLFTVDGLPNQLYPAMWVRPDGTLVFYKTSEEVYEVSMGDGSGNWTVTRSLTGPASLRDQRDGASCPILAPPPADADGDGVPDATDNCPTTFNPDQTDSDGNGVGDACQPPPTPHPDRDGDGIPNEADNCPDAYNPDQADLDRDGIGDVCDGALYACNAIADLKREVHAANLHPQVKAQLLLKAGLASASCQTGLWYYAAYWTYHFNQAVHCYRNHIPASLRASWTQRANTIVQAYCAGKWECYPASPASTGVGRLTAEIVIPAPKQRSLNALHAAFEAEKLPGSELVPLKSDRTARLLADEVPEVLTLRPVFPNPTRQSATVSFGLPTAGQATVAVYDLMGREVAELLSSSLDAGWHEVRLDASTLASGLYVVRVQTPDGSLMQKVTVE